MNFSCTAIQTQVQKSRSLVNCKENQTAVQAATSFFSNYQSLPRRTQSDNSTVAEKLRVFGIKEFGKLDHFPVKISVFTPIQVISDFQGGQQKQSIRFLH